MFGVCVAMFAEECRYRYTPSSPVHTDTYSEVASIIIVYILVGGKVRSNRRPKIGTTKAATRGVVLTVVVRRHSYIRRHNVDHVIVATIEDSQ